MPSDPPQSILFVCYANAARSQMAQAYASFRAPAGVEIESAGLRTSRILPQAIAAMEAIGVSLDGQHSKSLDEVDLESFDLIVTFSDKAYSKLKKHQPPLPIQHSPILDPAGVRGSEQEVHDIFELTRGDVQTEVDQLFAKLYDLPIPARPTS